MPATIWTGTLSFVLVSIPVELVSAVRHDKVSFRMMHKKDNALLQRRMFCPKHKKYVHLEHIVNGYEVEKDKYVIVREEEYQAIEPKRSLSIEIDSFVDFDDIDPIYFDRPYYLLPGKGGLKSYQMLRQVMHETGKVGISNLILHTRQHLVAVIAGSDVIQLTTLYFHDQIRNKDEILPQIKAQAAKVKSITAQISKGKGKFDPDSYIDNSRKAILEFLEEKVKQHQTVQVQPPEETEEIQEPTEGDLIAALEESLAKVKS